MEDITTMTEADFIHLYTHGRQESIQAIHDAFEMFTPEPTVGDMMNVLLPYPSDAGRQRILGLMRDEGFRFMPRRQDEKLVKVVRRPVGA